MNSIRVASLVFVVALLCAPVPARAQGPPPGPGANISARVAALEAAVAKLQSGQIDVADLVGTYAGIVLQLELNAPAGLASIENQSAALTFTLNNDFTALISGLDRFCNLTQTAAATWSRACPSPESASNVAGNWFVDANGSLVVQIGGQDVINDPNFIGAGGRVVISAGTAGSGHTVFMVLIRMPNP
jgi:hypothetical protein